jgi:hypothetical protein
MTLLLSTFEKRLRDLNGLDELVTLVLIALCGLGLFAYIIFLVVQLSRTLDTREGQTRPPERSLRKALISTIRIDDDREEPGRRAIYDR